MTFGAPLRLADLCDRVVDSVNPRSRPDSIYLGLEHVPSGRLLPTAPGRASSVRSTTTAFRSGDVLYGKLRPYLDKAVIAPSDGVGTTELLVLRPKTGIDPKFLVAVLHAPDFLDYAVSGTTGSQHPRTSWVHIAEFPLPKFSARSRRAVSAVVWLVHEAMATVETAITAGVILRERAMRRLFTQGLRDEPTKDTEIGSIPRSWEVVEVGDATVPYRFDSSKQVPASRYRSSGRWPIIDQGRKAVAGYTDRASEVLRPQEPVIVFGDHTRVFKYVDYPFAVGAQGTRLLQARPGFNPRYLYYALDSLDIEDRGYNRHMTVLKDKSVAKPLLEEQCEIAQVLGTIDLKLDLHRRKKVVLEQLFRTLLHDLMTGRIRADDLELPDIGTDTDADADATPDSRE